MLEYLIQIPSETLGHNILGFLDMVDIIQLENAAASSKSQQLLKTILPYCPPILVESAKVFLFNRQAIIWCNKRRLRVQHAKILVESLCEVSTQYNVFGCIELYLKSKATCQDIEPLKNSNINQRVTSMIIHRDQDPAVMKVLFTLLSSVRSLDIRYSNLSQWMEHIKNIGPYLREICIVSEDVHSQMIKSITEYCPYLEKLSIEMHGYQILLFAGNHFLQSIANNCRHLRLLKIFNVEEFGDPGNDGADAELTAFAEKCPQLEELGLDCEQLTDQSVIALAQHCSRLKKLELNGCDLTAASLIALSERGLPLEELALIPWIPITSAEIAAQCAHALSLIRELNTRGSVDDRRYAIQYMTGLRQLCLNRPEDHLLVPYLLLLLQGQCCASLESLTIWSDSSITPQQLIELVQVTGCCKLLTLFINMPTYTSDAVLVELARNCPHLQKVTLDSNGKVTEEGVLALTAHCRQLRAINIKVTTDYEIITWKLEHCPRRLTKTCSPVSEYDIDYDY